MKKLSRVHFLTAYFEYLLRNGIRSQRTYVGDASRFMRFLLARASEADVEAFIAQSAQSPAYARRLRKTLKKFFGYARLHLDVDLPREDV